MDGDEAAPEVPRVFISYSWSDADHEEWVVDLAERLMGSGVWVVLDKWDLQPGQDAYAFMERMVTDPTVTKVLMVCDRAYVDKASARAGGVGAEAQILSPQLYRTGATNQTRIAAACRDRDDQGEPMVPVFYQSRIHFDFSSRDRFDQAFEDVLNWAFNRPRFIRPPLGRQLATVSDAVTRIITPRAAASLSTLAMQRATAFREARLDDLGGANALSARRRRRCGPSHGADPELRGSGRGR